MARKYAKVEQGEGTIERTSIATYGLLQQLDAVLSEPGREEDIHLGMLMGLAIFLDDKIGPFRMQRLLNAAPDIILRTDAHIVPEQLAEFAPLLKAFGEHLSALTPVQAERAVTVA